MLLTLLAINTVRVMGRRQGGAGRKERSREGLTSAAEEDPETGLCCVDKEETVTTIKKDPILECTHKNTKQCHYTYVTQFTPTQEEVCKETFKKSCSITFKK